MRRSEALAELELGEDATPREIKAAYRDLVKVWHPDRFGDNSRLRQRAEERLQRINEAYRRLESGDFAPEPSFANEFVADAPPRVRVKTRAEKDRELRGWVYLAIFLAVGAFVGFAIVRHVRAEREAAEMVTPVQGPSGATPVLSARPTGDSNKVARREEPAVRVTHLSDAQMQQIATACGGIAPDSQLHVDCVRAQVAAMTGAVDMTGLTAEERLSVQHVCARATSYGQCAAAQIASLSAVTLRPDVSRLNSRDRSAVERACVSARDHDGPAAYDRCVVEFEKVLATQR
ncbi:MAG TPA: J domain-containing protein [Acidobacteriaceae bacterium]|nr:J domain-containing protein [Acidobacteriaceae bacterium]